MIGYDYREYLVDLQRINLLLKRPMRASSLQTHSGYKYPDVRSWLLSTRLAKYIYEEDDGTLHVTPSYLEELHDRQRVA